MEDETEELKCLSELNKNSKWISSVYEEIRKKYAGKFIAVKNSSVIDSDDNVGELLSRLHMTGENLDCITVEFVPPHGLLLIL